MPNTTEKGQKTKGNKVLSVLYLIAGEKDDVGLLDKIKKDLIEELNTTSHGLTKILKNTAEPDSVQLSVICKVLQLYKPSLTINDLVR